MAFTHNLPAQLTTFVGRANDLRALSGMIRMQRLVTLTGVGGAGKTRLAIEVAARCATELYGAARMVELAPLRDANLVPAVVLHGIGLSEEPGYAPLDSIVNGVGDDDLLVVLDNCEHLIEPTATLATRLLRACPRLRILATSREALGVVGEAVWPVGPLDVTSASSEGVRLFVDRARLAHPDLALTPEVESMLLDICSHLEGLPLAIELAASRASELSIAELRAGLDDRFALLHASRRGSDDRHRSLRAALDWSHELLSDEEAVLFRRLAVFDGGFNRDAVAAVCAEPAEGLDVVDSLTRLTTRSLITVDTTGTTARYRMLETVREFALEKLAAASGEEPSTRDRHLDWCTGLAIELTGEMPTRGAFTRVVLEQSNMNGALRWSTDSDQPDRGLELANLLADVWVRRLRLSEATSWYDSLLPPGRETSWRLRAGADRGRAAISWAHGQLAEARMMYDDAFQLYQQAGDHFGMAETLRGIGTAIGNAGDLDGARDAYTRAIHLYRGVGHPWGVAACFTNLGRVELIAGDPEAAERLYRGALALVDDRAFGRGYALWGLATAAYERGDVDHAEALYHEALDLHAEAGAEAALGDCLDGLAAVAIARSDPRRALRLLAASDAQRERLSAPSTPAKSPWRQRHIRAASAVLDKRSFAAAWDAGSRLSVTAAIQLAREPTGRASSGAALPDGLTRREGEVMRLVAEGATNREIAATLFISEKTVARHLSNVFTKIDVSTRAAAAAYAHRNLLVDTPE